MVTKYNSPMPNRKVTYRLYPNKTQHHILSEMLCLHQRVYNTALEERIRLYRDEGRPLSFADQCKVLTGWRHAHQELAALNAQSLQVTLKRLDLAFQAFFCRVKNGEKPGFPRFKPIQRFAGWGYKTHGDGWRFFTDDKGRHGRLRLSGVGMIPLRGKARTEGIPKTCEILHRSGKWYLSLTIVCHPSRRCGTRAVAFDWGVKTFLVTHDSEGKTEQTDNPRHLKKRLSVLKLLQQSVTRKKKGSVNRKKAVRALAAEHGRIARRRLDFHHQTAARIVQKSALIAAEILSVKNMTASGGPKKRGLNREILSTAPSQFYQLLRSKAEEAGTVWVDIPTKQVKPSQTCHRCGIQQKKTLMERWHECGCGAACDRDENAARVILNWALYGAPGQELAEVGSRRDFAALSHETPTIA